MSKQKPASLEERVAVLERAMTKLFADHNRQKSDIVILKAKAGIVTLPDPKPPAPTQQTTPPKPPVPAAPAEVATPLLDKVPVIPPEKAAA